MKPRIPNHVHDTTDGEEVTAGPSDASPIGTGVQAFLVLCGIALFAGGLALSFGSIGGADFIGGTDDEVSPDDDDIPDPDDGETGDDDQADDGDADGDADSDNADDTDSGDDGVDADDADTGDNGDNSTEYEPPVLETNDATTVTESAADLHGELTDLGDEDSVNVYFEYRTVGSDSWSATDGAILSSESDFEMSLSGFDEDTEYEFRATAETDDGEVFVGDVQQFTTDSGEDADVETHDARDIDETEATLHGELIEMGGSDNAFVYFEWRAAGEDSWQITDPETLSDEDEFSVDLEGLENETQYEFRAIVETNDGEIAQGDIESFETDSENGDDDDSDDGDDDDDGFSPFSSRTG